MRESVTIDIASVIEMSRLILSNVLVLATSGSLVVDGKAGFTALIDVIRDEGHSVKTLTESGSKQGMWRQPMPSL